MGGNGNTATHDRSVIVGGASLSTSKADEVVVPNLSVNGDLDITSGSYSGSAISNITDTYTTTPEVDYIVSLTQAEYDAIGTPNSSTLYVINDATGSLVVSASYAQTASVLDGTDQTSNLVFSGSIRGEVEALTITSNTASMDCSTGNFFSLGLQNATDTHLTVSNVNPGQTINLKVTNNATAAGTLSFGPGIEFAGGTAFTVTAATNAVDVMTFVSFDSSTIQATGLLNFS